MLCKQQGPCEAFGCDWPDCREEEMSDLVTRLRGFLGTPIAMELVRQAADALERAEAERDEMRASIGRITTEEALTLRAERDALRALLAEVLPWAPLHKNLRDRIDAMLRESGK